jgi:hypothetical protein
MPTPRVISHLLDPKRGRASKTKMWTLCGEQAMTRLCYNYQTMVDCKACLLMKAASDVTAFDWRTSVAESYHFARIDALDGLRSAMARVRGEQTQDA